MKKSFSQSLLAATLVCISAPAFAAGFQLSEYSATGLGRAFAGGGVVGDDYSAIAFNPAGMNAKKNGGQVGTAVVFIKADADNNLSANDSTGDINLTSVVPHAFVQMAPTEKARLGFGVYVPFGLSTKYDSDWFGNTRAIKSEINVIDVAVAGSYEVAKGWSLGGSVFGERLYADLTNAIARNPSTGEAIGINEVEGNQWAAGYSLGVVYEPIKDATKLGVSYHSKVGHSVKGKNKVYGSPVPSGAGYLQDGYYDASAKITLPEYILLSAYQKVDQVGLSASAKWTRWSRFENLDIYSDNFPMNADLGARGARVEEDWRNVWSFGVGADWYVNKKWTLRMGLGYDQTPVKDAEHRTARIPDGNRWLTSVGASYTYNAFQFDVGYTHMFIKDTKSYHAGLDADYEMMANILAASVQYSF